MFCPAVKGAFTKSNLKPASAPGPALAQKSIGSSGSGPAPAHRPIVVRRLLNYNCAPLRLCIPTLEPPPTCVFAGCSSGLLPAHCLFDQSNDHHQDASSDTAGEDLTDNRANIEAARSTQVSSRSAADQGADDLGSHPSAD